MINIRQATFLVVDDSQTMRKIVSEMLQDMGAVSVDHAASGEEALHKLQNSSYTIIISDWNMAPLDGIDLLRVVRKLQRPRINRFIFMTSENSYGHYATAKVEGADEFISKPFKINSLREKIDKVLAYCR